MPLSSPDVSRCNDTALRSCVPEDRCKRSSCRQSLCIVGRWQLQQYVRTYLVQWRGISRRSSRGNGENTLLDASTEQISGCKIVRITPPPPARLKYLQYSSSPTLLPATTGVSRGRSRRTCTSFVPISYSAWQFGRTTSHRKHDDGQDSPRSIVVIKS